MPPNYNGVPDDPRDDPRVKEGWQIDELLPGDAPLMWVKKNENEIKDYPTWNQDGSSACVAFAKARQVATRIHTLTGQWIDLSPASIYQLRPNKPNGGMNIAEANDIVNKRGVALEAFMKSQRLSEVKIDLVERTPVAELSAKAFAEAVVRYFYMPIDIDRIAQTIESGRAVSLLIFSNEAEYARKVPVVISNTITYANADIRHEITAVDYFINSNAERVLRIKDSAHFGGFAERDITKEFLEKRCILADAIEVFNLGGSGITIPDIIPDVANNKPVFDGSIMSAQRCLKYEGLFPADVAFVNNLGPVTKKAINDFQKKYGLSTVGTGTLGPLTRAKLYQLYPIKLPNTGDNDEIPEIPYRGVV